MTAGPCSQPGYKGCGWKFSIGPAGEVEHHALLLGLKAIVAGYGGEGAEEQVASVGHAGGAAGSDFVSGLELIEFAEGVVDVGGGAEFLNVTDEGGGKVGLVEVFLEQSGVSGAEAGVRIRDGHAATPPLAVRCWQWDSTEVAAMAEQE